jgi:hypothetical protein
MGALNFLPGQPQKWAAGTGRNKVLLHVVVVESAPQRRLPNTRVWSCHTVKYKHT